MGATHPSPRLLRCLAATLAVATSIGVSSVGAAPAAAAERYTDRVFDHVTVTHDIAYGAAPDEHGVRQVLDLDLFVPTDDTETRRPVVILAHGGGFNIGAKEDMFWTAMGYAFRGFVAMSIEYRMDEAAGGIGFPPTPAEQARIVDAREDMQAAVRWTRDRAHVLGVDPGKIAVGGVSAGAVTAVLTATVPDQVGASGTPGLSSRVCTAVSISGAGNPAVVDSGDAGAIFLHGDQDHGLYEAAVATEAAMAAAGLESTMVTFPGMFHDLENVDELEQLSSEWMRDVVVDRPTSCVGPIDPSHPAFVKAAYADLVGHAPSTTALLHQVNRLDSGASRGGFLRLLTTSEEWVSGIVTDLYADTLGRAPDAGGLAFWTDQIRRGRRTVAQVAAAFYGSAEYIAATGDDVDAWLDDLYASIVGRSPSEAERQYWAQKVTVLGPTWIATHVYGSPEARRARVTGLYGHLLGRAPDAGGLAYWAMRIAAEGDLALARHLAASPEYRTRAVARFP